MEPKRKRSKGVIRVSPGNKIVAGGGTLLHFVRCVDEEPQEGESLDEMRTRLKKETEEDLEMWNNTSWYRPLPSFRKIIKQIFTNRR